MELERGNGALQLKAGLGARLSAFQSCYATKFLLKLHMEALGWEITPSPGFSFLVCRLLRLRWKDL